MKDNKASTRYVDVPAMYDIPYTRDEYGYLSIDYQMSKENYESYKEMQEAIMQQIQKSRSEAASCLRNIDCSIDKSWLALIYQDDDRCKAISYPSPNDSTRTFSTSGMFPLTFYTILKFFGKSETLENLAMIANYGRWQHDNGTWWHYIDVMARAYGLEVCRTSNLISMMRCMEEDYITPVLLDRSVHPTGKGNLLAIPTEIRDGKVELYSPAFNGEFKTITICEFVRNLKMIWVIGNSI